MGLRACVAASHHLQASKHVCCNTPLTDTDTVSTYCSRKAHHKPTWLLALTYLPGRHLCNGAGNQCCGSPRRVCGLCQLHCQQCQRHAHSRSQPHHSVQRKPHTHSNNSRHHLAACEHKRVGGALTTVQLGYCCCKDCLALPVHCLLWSTN